MIAMKIKIMLHINIHKLLFSTGFLRKMQISKWKMHLFIVNALDKLLLLLDRLINLFMDQIFL